jgi:pimeloyl-ACP methyl ester carboxylesterase
MRARYPDIDGYVERDGVKVFYEVYGSGEPTILLMPTWPIVHSRMWKAQIPFLARHHRVVTFDPRGNGRSDRPQRPEAYTDDQYVGDTMQVLDETDTDRAILVGLCPGVRWSFETAALHPDRVLGLVAIAPGVPFLTPPHAFRAKAAETFDQVVDESEGWAARENRHYWLRDYRGWVEYHSGEVFMLPEPHSTKAFEDLVAWGLETDAQTLLITHDAPGGDVFPSTLDETEALCRSVRCPILILHGTDDLCQPIDRARRLAEITGGALVELEGAGHAPMARHPVLVNLWIKDFVDRIHPPAPVPRTVSVGPSSAKRVLFLSSPIGLGHARRDLAVADALRELRPDVTVEWMTQHPVTAALAARGERVHPACDWLANESQHVESEAGEHDVNVFQALRSMDEILVANFMVFREVLESQQYDLVVGDESWDVDHFLHEHPQLKRAPFVWMTDFVGFLPMPDGGEREAFLTADYNAEMIEHVEGHPRVRDRSIFVGDPDDIVPDGFGPGMPSIREWTEGHYDFAGYVTGYDPAETADREALRAELGYRPDERVCVVTVGGSGVGGYLLRKVIDAYPEAKDAMPDLRMVVVTGPRLDPDSFKATDGLEIVGYVPGLHRHLAACDVAVVHGGLTTTMELVANKRPFLYFPIGHHFEENFHVRHRLERYGAGRRMDYTTTDPSAIAEAIAHEAGREVRYRDVETGGAARAAALIAEVL